VRTRPLVLAVLFAFVGRCSAQAADFTPDQIAAIKLLAAADDATVLCPGFGGTLHSANVNTFLARHGLTQDVLASTQIEEKLDNLDAAKADTAGFCARFIDSVRLMPELRALVGDAQ
jgi:hypothetical protein